VWIEQKKACVAPFANDVRVIFDGEGGDGKSDIHPEP
jgi:hypothetical protein